MVHAILERAPDVTVALENLAYAIMPMTWSGSRADILQKRSMLFTELEHHDNSEIRAWAKSKLVSLQEIIKNERAWEADQDRARNESFE